MTNLIDKNKAPTKRELNLAAFWAALRFEGDPKNERHARWIVRHYHEWWELIEFIRLVDRFCGYDADATRRKCREIMRRAICMAATQRNLNLGVPPIRNLGTNEPEGGGYDFDW